MIKLMKSTFYDESNTKKELCEFIAKADRLSLGLKCAEFEEEFSKYQGRKYSVMFNSGSSANLAIVQALVNLKKISKGDKAAFPAVTWSTSVMPLIQTGLEIVPVDVSISDLNLSHEGFVSSIKDKNIKLLFTTNLLGFCSEKLELIKRVCDERGIILIEDNCESLGSVYLGKKLGNFGLASSFSFFVGHAMSTIEGGMVSTDDEELRDMLHLVRAHGWDRSFSDEKKARIRKENGINDFYGNFSFYNLAYNLRPTEINGFLGLNQIRYIDEIIEKRHDNFKKYHSSAKKNPSLLHFNFTHMEKVSNHAYPLVFRDTATFERYKEAFSKRMEIRPIVAGNMVKQPFLKGLIKEEGIFPNADKVHDFGFYIPNHPEITKEEIELICSLIEGKWK